MKDNFKIIIVGLLQPLIGSGKVHLQDYIYSTEGFIRDRETKRNY